MMHERINSLHELIKKNHFFFFFLQRRISTDKQSSDNQYFI